MIRTRLFSVLLIGGAATASQVASAGDGTITFEGTVIAQTCVINGGGSGASTFTVTLPSVSTSALASAGAIAGGTPFTIGLTGCKPGTGPGAMNLVHAYFEPGANVDIETDNLKLTEGEGSAANVQIRLLNRDRSQILLGRADVSQSSEAVQLDDTGAATLQFYAQYYAKDRATAGSVNTQIQYTIMYQ